MSPVNSLCGSLFISPGISWLANCSLRALITADIIPRDSDSQIRAEWIISQYLSRINKCSEYCLLKFSVFSIAYKLFVVLNIYNYVSVSLSLHILK